MSAQHTNPQEPIGKRIRSTHTRSDWAGWYSRNTRNSDAPEARFDPGDLCIACDAPGYNWEDTSWL